MNNELLSNLCDRKLNHLINIVKFNSLILNKKKYNKYALPDCRFI